MRIPNSVLVLLSGVLYLWPLAAARHLNPRYVKKGSYSNDKNPETGQEARKLKKSKGSKGSRYDTGYNTDYTTTNDYTTTDNTYDPSLYDPTNTGMGGPDQGNTECSGVRPMFVLQEDAISDQIISRMDGVDSAGDLYVWNNPIVNAADNQNAVIRGSCIRIVDGTFDWVCNIQYCIKDGDIFLQGGLPKDIDSTAMWGITGGTRCYKNISGYSMISYLSQSDNVNGYWNHVVEICYN